MSAPVTRPSNGRRRATAHRQQQERWVSPQTMVSAQKKFPTAAVTWAASGRALVRSSWSTHGASSASYHQTRPSGYTKPWS